ncbi:MAG: C40 family peptidase [Fibrobacteres bacterium]|nr:C40 family peptidase [Fibrobacterota bacterium]
MSADKGLFGDLIFFDTNGMGQVSHVGVIYGDGTFVHSCSSVGVTFTPLSNSYFKKRLLALGRVAG